PLRVRLTGVTEPVSLTGFTGQEGISQLFHFELTILAPNRVEIPFQAVLGKPATAELALSDHETRYFHGILSRFAQGQRGPTHTVYRAVLVPRLWLWTRLAQSRIFQELSVPDILQKVLGEYGGLKMNFLAKRSDFPPR